MDIGGGLNTSVQVQSKSLDNLAGLFDWLKEELADQPYIKKIAWRENDPGEYDVVYLLQVLTCFNIYRFPNEKDEQPVNAYARKSDVLKWFEADPQQYQRLRPIAKDIFRLHDLIGYESREIYNIGVKGRFGKWSFVEMKKPGPYVFTGQEPSHQLMTGALFPILGAFRWMVEPYEAGVVRR